MTKQEYIEICNVLAAYKKYESLYNRYFCEPVTNSQTGDQTLIFSEQLEERNAAFFANWQQKRQKIEARLAKNSYFKLAGKNRDEKDLRLGKRKFEDLQAYYELDAEFASLEASFLSLEPKQTLAEYIAELIKKKLAYEKTLRQAPIQPQM